MSQIKPFRGIRPSQAYIDQVASKIEHWNFSDLQKNPYSVVPTLTSKSQEQLLSITPYAIEYEQVNEYISHLSEDSLVVKDAKPTIYVYQIHSNGVQTGVWTTTSIDDYLENKLKKHELIRPDKQQRLIDILEKTGIDANPILITYAPDKNIQLIIDKIIAKKETLIFYLGDTIHKLWKLDNEEQISTLVEAFLAIQTTYIADGHHRVAALAALGVRQRQHNVARRGTPSYNYFNSVYMPTDQLQIFEYNRLIENIGNLPIQQLLDRIEPHFEIQILPNFKEFKPQQIHEFGMYANKTWYRLRAYSHTYQQHNEVDNLDVSILQHYLFGPSLNITDPQTDTRLSFVGGLVPLQISMQKIDQGDYSILFTLFPISIQQFMAVVDSNQIMPPKSTWFEPKFQSGLVVHQLFDSSD